MPRLFQEEAHPAVILQRSTFIAAHTDRLLLEPRFSWVSLKEKTMTDGGVTHA